MKVFHSCLKNLRRISSKHHHSDTCHSLQVSSAQANSAFVFKMGKTFELPYIHRSYLSVEGFSLFALLSMFSSLPAAIGQNLDGPNSSIECETSKILCLRGCCLSMLVL